MVTDACTRARPAATRYPRGRCPNCRGEDVSTLLMRIPDTGDAALHRVCRDCAHEWTTPTPCEHHDTYEVSTWGRDRPVKRACMACGARLPLLETAGR